MSEDWSADLRRWLQQEALPLWSTTGVDCATGTVWEALDHQGRPCRDMMRRLRVQVRQAYCFAKAEDPELHRLGLQLFRFAMDRGFAPDTDQLGAQLAPDASLLTAPHDLYDMAFMLLAAAALLEAGFDVEADLARLETGLARLKAPRGWHEDIGRRLPRRQNPHMHLFEAMTALYRATRAPRFLAGAEECLGLFRDVFLQPDGKVLEFFDPDWHPVEPAAQAIEPGHMAEWIYLLDRFECVTGQRSGVDPDPLFANLLQSRDEMGLLPDCAMPRSETRRTWPQTEFLKAALVMHRRAVPLPEEVAPDRILASMWAQYLETPVPGGWYDRRHRQGRLLSDNMPASTFYHLLVAFEFYQDVAESGALGRKLGT